MIDLHHDWPPFSERRPFLQPCAVLYSWLGGTMVPQVHFYPAYKKSTMYGYKITLIKSRLDFFTTKIGFAVVSLIFIASCVVRHSRFKGCALSSFTISGIHQWVNHKRLPHRQIFFWHCTLGSFAQVTVGTKSSAAHHCRIYSPSHRLCDTSASTTLPCSVDCLRNQRLWDVASRRPSKWSRCQYPT